MMSNINKKTTKSFQVDESEKNNTKGKQKKIASPKSTGGRGFSFEHRVQATRLLAMCIGSPCVGLPDGNVIVKLNFQGRVGGSNTDDLVIDFQSPEGEPGTLRMQLKRALSPTTSNTVFKESVGLAWLDFKHSAFRRGRDVLLIVYQTPSAKSMEAAVEVTRLAVASTGPEIWKSKVQAERFSNEKNRVALSAIAAAAQAYNGESAVSDSDLHEFAMHLKFAHHDLDSDNSPEAINQQQIIGIYTSSTNASLYWSKIVQVCVELNGVGGDIDLNSIGRFFGPEFDAAFKAVRVLRESNNGLGGILKQVVTQSIDPIIGVIPTQGANGQYRVGSFSEAVPASRGASLNKLVSRQLDRIRDLHKDLRYQEAFEQLDILGQDQSEFDDYQRSLWHLLRGMCRWHFLDDPKGASQDFIRAADLYEDEPKFAAARIRGYLLVENIADAISSGEIASKRFPAAHDVWLAYTNARILNGEKIFEDDIPVEYREFAGTWQVVASSYEINHDYSQAFKYAKIGAEQADSSFFNRELMLRYALQDVTKSNVRVGFRILTPSQIEAFETAISAFSDRQRMLWIALQAPRALLAVIINLGYAYVLTGRPQDAIDLMREAEHRGINVETAESRVLLDAYRELGRSTEVLPILERSLSKMSDDALVAFAQAAIDAEDEARLESAYAQAVQRGEDTSLVKTLRSMRRELMLRVGNVQVVRDELAAEGVGLDSSSILDLMYLARCNFAKGGDRDLASNIVTRISELVLVTQDDFDLYIGAQILLSDQRYSEAATAYSRLLPADTFSDLHIRLLECYVRSGQRTKAKELLISLPQIWEQSEEMRHWAIDLARLARDWLEVTRLATIELQAFPSLLRSWILRIEAAVHCCNSEEIIQLLHSVPFNLSGSVQDCAKLASLEIQFGQSERGLLRLYQMRRKNLGDAESAALHLMAILMPGTALKELDVEPDVVASGTAVTVESEDGVTRTWTIDPEEISDLQATDEFMSSSAKEVASLVGRSVGDSVEIRGNFGESKSIRIVRLISAHRRLLELSHYTIQTTLAPTKYLASMQMRTTPDGNLELDEIRQQIERRAAFATETLNIYKQHPASLGMVARRLGVDVIDLIRGWPNNGPKLEIAFDWQMTLPEVLERLEKGVRWVIDLPMLVELATLNCLHLLQNIPELYVSTATTDEVERKLEASATFRRSGTMFTHEGKLGFRENTEVEWEQECKFLQEISSSIRNYCKVQPAYGVREVSQKLTRMQSIFSEMEYSNILLCQQIGANLLTLDDRFRRAALLFECNGAGLQAFLLHMRDRKLLREKDYSLAVIKMLLNRRTFISIHSRELELMVDMGDDFLRFSLEAVRDYLCQESVEFGSAFSVVIAFIHGIFARGSCDFGAALELVGVLGEALMRHPQVPPSWEGTLVFHVWRALRVLDHTQRQLVVRVVLAASQRSKLPLQPIVLGLRVIRTSEPPMVLYGASFLDTNMINEVPKDLGSETLVNVDEFQATVEHG